MPYKKGFGPFAPEVYRAQAPYPYRGIGTAEALASVRSCSRARSTRLRGRHDLRAGAGRGRVPPGHAGLHRGLVEICREYGIVYIDDEVQSGMRRTG